MISIALRDESSDPDVCAALGPIASCVALQCNGEFKRAWGIDDVAIGVGQPLLGQWPAVIVPTLDDPDALAYHSDDSSGYPTLFVGRDVILKNGGTVTKGSNSISAAFSHEVLEALIDAWCDYWADWRDGTNLVSLEVCDPVEDGSYEVSDGTSIVTVSNFVYQEWFRPGTTRTKFDHLSQLSAPLTLSPEGYVALRSGQQIFGERMPDWKRALKRSSARRARILAHKARRLVAARVIPDNPQVG